MNTDTILRLLKNSGINVIGADGSFLYIEDPACILRGFSNFIEYAWVAIACITGLFLFGWAISMIRGAKVEIFTNLRNLIIIFGTLSAAGAILNTVYGGDLIAQGCKTMKVPMDEVNKLLDARNAKLTDKDEYNLYEEYDIYDSGIQFEEMSETPISETPYADAPISGAGEVGHISYDKDAIALDNVNSAGNSTDAENTTSPTTENTATNIARDAINANAPNSARADGNDVIYTDNTGNSYKRTGGTRAWRNQNPGNIRYSDFTKRQGAIGSAGGFAVFPDAQTGQRAISALMLTNSYKNLTIANAISRYAPPSENNTSAYHNQIAKLTGLSINKKISDLNEAELARVANAIRKIEGWGEGRELKL